MMETDAGSGGGAAETVEYGDRPSVLVIGDSEASVERARAGANRGGWRISDGVRIEAAAARLDRQIATGAVLVEVEGEDPGRPFEELLDRLNEDAILGRYRSVVTTPPALIDRVAARTPHHDIQQLCQPSEAERVMAIALATAGRIARLDDVGRRQAPPRLQQLTEQVERMASMLAKLSEEENRSSGCHRGEQGKKPSVDAGLVRAIYKARRLREDFFDREMFADPAWDMLLDLMAARLEGQQVAVSSLCIAAAVPPTTALRWIKTLCEQGLFVRLADPHDGRRVFIELSDEAAAGMEAYLISAQRISPLLI